jgi:hypothetical protein
VRKWVATLLAVGASTAIFVVVRNELDLEDSRFLTALLALSILAFALFATTLDWDRAAVARSTLGHPRCGRCP